MILSNLQAFFPLPPNEIEIPWVSIDLYPFMVIETLVVDSMSREISDGSKGIKFYCVELSGSERNFSS